VGKNDNNKLPRRGHAAPLADDEKVRKLSDADLQNGWLGRHGKLHLTDERLLFVPTPLDRLMLAKRREIMLDDMTAVERYPRSVNDLPSVKRSRMILHTDECNYEFMVGDVDAWIDAIEKVFDLRRKAGRPHMPEILRDDYENLLLAEE